MNSCTIGTRQLGLMNPRTLGAAVAIAGLGIVMAMFAASLVGTGQASPEYNPPVAQAAPSSHERVGYFPDRFGPVMGEIEPPIAQF
jgi:hypothetical protein